MKNVNRHEIKRYNNSGEIDEEGEFVRFMDVFDFDTSFKNVNEFNTECCPFCACESDIHNSGTTSCDHCGAPNVVPCNACKDANHPNDYCDWSKENGCTPFPIKNFKLSPEAVSRIVEVLNGEHEAFGNLLDKEPENHEYLQSRKDINNIISVLEWEYKEIINLKS